MAYIPYAPQTGCKYVLTGPTGLRAVFNDPADADYVGALSGDGGGITGLDSAEVRESAEDLVESDGGAHGYFYFGRRPIVLTAQVNGFSSLNARDVRVDKARRVAKQLMRADGVLSWQNDPVASTAGMQTWVRLQQPMRQTGQWNKELQLPLVSQYAPLFGAAARASGTMANNAWSSLENKGDALVYPVVRITGTSSNPYVVSSPDAFTFVGRFNTTGLTLASGEVVEFDFLSHTGTFIAGARAGQSANRYIDFATTVTWPYFAPATSTSFFFYGGSGTMVVYWRDAWL